MSTALSPYKIDTDTHTLHLWKNSWEQLDCFVAECIGIDFIDGMATLDLTYVCPKATDAFVRHIYKIDDNSPKYMMEVYGEISAAATEQYGVVFDKFQEVFSPRLREHVKGYKLAKHQIDNIPFFMTRKHNGLFWEQRAGKTITSAMVSDLLSIKKTIIVTSNTAKYSWYKELPNWDFSPHRFSLLGANRKKNMLALQENFVFVNYDVLDKYLDKFKQDEFGHIVFGECHKIKNTETKKWEWCEKLVLKNPNAKITLETGTPVANRINDLFGYLKISGHTLGRDYATFADWFITFRKDGAIAGVKNATLLNTCLSNFWSRVLTSECFDLPKEQHDKITFSLEEYQEEYDRKMKELYEKSQLATDLKKEFSEVFDTMEHLEAEIKLEEDKHKANELRKELLRVQSRNNNIIEQVKALEQQAKVGESSSLHSLNKLTAFAKIKGVIELAEEIIENSGKVIIYSHYKDPLKVLADHFKGRCLFITGETSDHERSRIEDEFKINEKIEVIIGTEAASESLDLSVANNTIIMSMPLSPRPLQQFIKRMQNAGKTIDLQPVVTIHYMTCEGTVDDILYDLVASKIQDIRETVDKGKEIPDLDNIPHKAFKLLMNQYKNKKP